MQNFFFLLIHAALHCCFNDFFFFNCANQEINVLKLTGFSFPQPFLPSFSPPFSWCFLELGPLLA